MKKAKDPVFNVDTPEESTGFLLWQVTNLWQREIKKALETHELTHSQFVLMASILWLSRSEKNITQVLLAAHTKIDPMTTSTVLRTLQQKVLLKREEHSTDTRAKTVRLTPAGEKMAKLAVKAVAVFDDNFFEPLGKNTKDFNKKLNLLLMREQ